MRTERGGRKGRRAHTEPLIRLPGTAAGARYYRVYVKSVHKGRQQKNSYLRSFVARKRWCSRRGNPCGCPGVGGHEGRPYTKRLSYAQFLDRRGTTSSSRLLKKGVRASTGSAPTENLPQLQACLRSP